MRYIFIFALSTFIKPIPNYLIVTGDITCKSCVIQLYEHLVTMSKNDKITIGVRDKESIILNDNTINYFQKELPTARFVIIRAKSLFREREKYPYLLKVLAIDTLKIPYDSLFVGDYLRINSLH